MLHPSLTHLENIDQRFLDPNAGFVVMPETTEAALDDACLALHGLASVFQSVAEANCKLRAAEAHPMQLELPADSMAALMRMVYDQIKPATGNPTLGAVQSLRPDLFHNQGV